MPIHSTHNNAALFLARAVYHPDLAHTMTCGSLTNSGRRITAMGGGLFASLRETLWTAAGGVAKVIWQCSKAAAGVSAPERRYLREGGVVAHNPIICSTSGNANRDVRLSSRPISMTGAHQHRVCLSDKRHLTTTRSHSRLTLIGGQLTKTLKGVTDVVAVMASAAWRYQRIAAGCGSRAVSNQLLAVGVRAGAEALERSLGKRLIILAPVVAAVQRYAEKAGGLMKRRINAISGSKAWVEKQVLNLAKELSWMIVKRKLVGAMTQLLPGKKAGQTNFRHFSQTAADTVIRSVVTLGTTALISLLVGGLTGGVAVGIGVALAASLLVVGTVYYLGGPSAVWQKLQRARNAVAKHVSASHSIGV